MRMAVILALSAAALAVVAPLARSEAVAPPGPVHQSVAVVVRIDRATGLVMIKQDDGRLLRLFVDGASAGDDFTALQPGDIVREQCAMDGGGILKARLILRMRRAWQEIGSPEL